MSFITHGCKYLIRQADPEALFLPVSNTQYDSGDWKILFKEADCLVLAGMPLYDLGDVRVYWNYDIWEHINTARSLGIPIVDLCGYSSCPLPGAGDEVMSSKILPTERTQRLLKIQSKFKMVLTRDTCAGMIASTVVPKVEVLPCCSFYAHKFYGTQRAERRFNAVIYRFLPGQEWVVKALYEVALRLSEERQTYLVFHNKHAYWWAKARLPESAKLICIYDPESLLRFYARCDKVVSIRLHASIPALSLGCRVLNVSIDTRSNALDQFGVSSTQYPSLKDADFELRFASVSVDVSPRMSQFIKRFRMEIVKEL